MPLINFKTNLTSLRFGMDQPGGGDSGQPFINLLLRLLIPLRILKIFIRLIELA